MESECEFIPIDLHSACNLGDVDIVEEILKREKTDINNKNDGDWTPLMYACWGGNEKLVTLLLRLNARKDEENHFKQTPLIVAVMGGCLNIVKLVFQKDLLGHVDINGKSALFHAVDFGFYDISSFLLDEGANANFSHEGMTVLMLAASNGHRALVDLLLQHGANLHTRNMQGFTAQQLAEMNQHQDIADMLDPANHVLPDLESLLESLDLLKYWPLFQKNQVDFQQFLQLDENDLKSLGVKLLGPRRKMSLAIAGFKKRLAQD
ncbi:ankyrin repeat and SAM domain-containing protein 3-like [Macrosteles quadrilineatus]|uniref:ankyrin repeat and SAM domain-containing protein 3-like n=1 Tax=Macrosteles quadrilineatus TaxID=74068 RepID=UPI0023E13C9F|nr:ankyrin repeat and SAM domain-containing protein 3-like [Macrosteles quadrilineatus]